MGERVTLGIPPERLAVYDAVYAVISEYPGSAERNAVIWRAVQAALVQFDAALPVVEAAERWLESDPPELDGTDVVLMRAVREYRKAMGK